MPRAGLTEAARPRPAARLSSTTPAVGYVGGDAPGLVAGEGLGRCKPSRLLPLIDVGERLPVGVADDEAGVGFLGGPGRREAALRHGYLEWRYMPAETDGRAVLSSNLRG